MHSNSSERGAIVAVMALIALMLFIFGISLAIDVPVSQSVAVDTQRAADNAARAGLNQLGDSTAAQNNAAAGFFAALSGRYDPLRLSRLFESSQIAFRTYIPTSNQSGLAAFRWQQCTSSAACSLETTDLATNDPLYSRYQSALQIFDPTGTEIDDFNNAFTVFARIPPLRFLPTISGRAPVEVASTAMLRTSMTYLLIDPAFSIEGNYQNLFGPDHCSDPSDTLWPVASPASVGGRTLHSGWAWPAKSPGMLTLPTTGATRPNTTEDDCVYHFYAEVCDTAPFWYFKRAAVSLIDRLASSSAFSSTTFVGLTGYDVLPPHVWSYSDIDGRFFGYRIPLVPIHPKFSIPSPMGAGCPEEVASHFPAVGTAFPLQNSDATNKSLSSRKVTAYEGFVDTSNPAQSVNRIRNCNGLFPTVAGSGLNRWELCLCRGLYADSSGAAEEYSSVVDETSGEDDFLSHQDRVRRVRKSEFTNWCDDNPSSVEDLVVELDKSQSGSGGGETPRNLVSELAIRMDDLGMEQANNHPPFAGWWVRPQEATTARTGWRDLGPSLRAASVALERGYQEYMASVPIGKVRPIDLRDRTIVTMGFSPWSITTQNSKVEIWGSLALADQALLDDFRNALQTTLCDSKQQLIFNFLPMSAFDRDSIAKIRPLISQLQNIYEIESRGGTPAAASFPDFNLPSCLDPLAPIAPVQLFVHDWTDPHYAAGSDAAKKLEAAERYSLDAPTNVLRLISQFDFRH